VYMMGITAKPMAKETIRYYAERMCRPGRRGVQPQRFKKDSKGMTGPQWQPLSQASGGNPEARNRAWVFFGDKQ
jgi:hypothetical protein